MGVKTANNKKFTETSPILGEKIERKKGCLRAFPARYALMTLGFFGFFNVYAMRVNLSIALVAMVNSSVETIEDIDGQTTVVCSGLLPFENQTDLTRSQGEFNWNSNVQGLILGSFFYGYVITQIPGGIIAERFGAKWLYGIGILVTSVFTLLTPIAAYWGVPYLVAVRVIEGLGEGVTYPAMNTLIGRWSPKMERSRMATFIFTGSSIGTVVAMALSGILSDSSFLGGWPSVFYVFGFFGCIWFIFWILLVHETPESHPRITRSELRYIQENQDELFKKKKHSTPWKSILSSVPVWVLAFTHFGQNWGFYTLLTEMPTYLSNILHFNIKKNGVLSSMPYLVQTILAWFASAVADRMRKNGHFKINTIRKIFNSVAFFGPGLCVLAVAFAGCRPILILVLLTIAMGLNGFMHSGFNVTHVDMSPEHAGTLMGLTNCLANFAGFLAPAAVGWITQDGHTLRSWGLVFVITSVVYFFAGILYDLFCSAERQPWSSPSEEEKENDTD